MKNILLLSIILNFFQGNALCQPLINEICPANISIIRNHAGDFDDYIEIVNTGQTSINLENYGISDDTDSTERFIFPEYTLAAGSKLLVFAVGDKKIDKIDHYEMPVDGNGIWSYSYDSLVTDSTWRDLSYDDSQWSTGAGGIGYGDNDDGTIVPVCQAVQMRYTFEVEDSLDVLEAILMMDFDDGFTAYLNGVEIASKNMWPGPLSWNIFANDAHEAGFYQGLPLDSFFIDPTTLKNTIRNGKNVLAVQTHNVEPNSSDLSSMAFLFFGMEDEDYIYSAPPSWFLIPDNISFNADFKLSRSGETVYLFDPSGNIIDQISYPAIESDHCYARSTDGSQNWCINIHPSPLESNDSFSCYSGYAQTPIFSLSGGFYSSPQTVDLISTQGNSTIRYSTNGDEPDSSSNVFTSSLILDSTTTIRARVFANGYLPGKTISHTFLLNVESKLPVFSISTDSLGLWDENTGIYVLGPNADTAKPYYGANFWQDWEIPASIEYYGKDKQKIFSVNAEIEIYGNYSRSKPQKSLEIHLKDRYGTGSIAYPLLSDKSFIREYENIILRNSGTDWNIVHFRDAFMEKIMKNTYSGYLAAEPVRVFLNGQDWGVYNLHEKNNHKWVETNFELEKGEYDFLSEEGIVMSVVEGSDKDFWELYDIATGQAPETDEYYNQVSARLDLKNFSDYFIAETYYNNGDWIGDWTNNIKLWRPKSENGRWKYVLLDLDFGMGLVGNATDNRLEIARNPAAFSHSSELFDAILENPKFKSYFINRYADLLNTIYLPSNVESVMRSFKDSMITDMVYHFNKWTNDTVIWNFNINRMMSFASQRPDLTRDMIKDQFGLNGKVSLTLQTNPPLAGRIEINTITPLSYPWEGIYFNGNPVTVTAIPNPGYTFDHWTASPLAGNTTEQQISLNFTSNDVLTAHFTGNPTDPKLNVSEFNYNSHSSIDSEDWIELNNYGNTELDISGWKIRDEEDHNSYTFPTGTKIASGGYLVVARDTCAFHSIYPDVSNFVGPFGFALNNSDDEIRVYDYLDQPYLSLIYQTQLPWPVEADGDGYTCELQNNSTDLSNGSNWAIGCFGGSPGRSSNNVLAFNIRISGENFFCSQDVCQLNALEISNALYEWSFNGDLIDNANLPYYAASETGLYSVELSIQNCSGQSEIKEVIETQLSVAPKITGGSRCGPGSVLLMANSEEDVSWFESINGEAIFTGNLFLTPELKNHKSYFVRSGDVCPSEMIEVEAKIRNECESEIAIYPNPSSGGASLILHYENLEAGNGLVQITDCCGKVLRSFSMEFSPYRSTYDLPILDFPQGAYLVSLYQNDFVYVTKMIRQ